MEFQEEEMRRSSAEPLAAAAEDQMPAEIDWEMLDKSRFFLLGAAFFSGVSAALHPIVVLKTRLQISRSAVSCLRAASSILQQEGPLAFYRGLATSLTGTIPARAVYMAALEVTKSGVGGAAARLGVSDSAAATVANAAAGLSAATAAQVVWTPIDVVSQRLMAQSAGGIGASYHGGIDATRKILMAEGMRGLYRGFGVSILTYAPSNAVWWASYSLSQRIIWGGIGGERGGGGGAAAVATMPLDTIKTRMQVLGSAAEGGGGKVAPVTVARTVEALLREGGWAACYRGLGPRWASMSMSAITMITTYELVKRLSAKSPSTH
ncbi:unnamed protein product [Spirodela intermedia]|uniref:Uncharacterized protein n=1 Tax=Spirodela intermedia TaxID=51605 RepID=A0A7I8IPC7_SPIIN|nr:unnamed protein product [Spirodela intermedia]CAA6659342.1 unnamed protein product [Spirodela intermedia]